MWLCSLSTLNCAWVQYLVTHPLSVSAMCIVPNVNALLLVCSAEATPVTLQVDLNNLFQLDKLVLSFKVPHSLFEHSHISFVITIINYLLILFVCLTQMPLFTDKILSTVHLFHYFLNWNLRSLFHLCPPKGPRPSEFVIERTLDNGRTWEPALYLATDCQTAFPGVPTTTPLRLDDVYCYTLPRTDNNPYQDHTVRSAKTWLFSCSI